MDEDGCQGAVSEQQGAFLCLFCGTREVTDTDSVCAQGPGSQRGQLSSDVGQRASCLYGTYESRTSPGDARCDTPYQLVELLGNVGTTQQFRFCRLEPEYVRIISEGC